MGIDTNLSAESWGPDFPVYRIGQRFASLADYEKTREQRAAPEFSVRLAPFSRKPLMATLSESLQRVNQAGAPTKWTQFAVCAPALGKGPEVRVLMLERGRDIEAKGGRT